VFTLSEMGTWLGALFMGLITLGISCGEAGDMSQA
jgi:hypothetical protein